MIRVDGREFWRSGIKIGFIDDEFIKNHGGEKIGYYHDIFVFNMQGHKLAYLEADYICFLNSSRKIRIEDNNTDISGGALSNIQRAAARVLLGD